MAKRRSKRNGPCGRKANGQFKRCGLGRKRRRSRR